MIALAQLNKKCYLCGRSEQEFASLLNPEKYDKKIAETESNITKEFKAISLGITSILEKTKNYDGTLSMSEVMDNESISSKFMPDWNLLTKHLTKNVIDSIKSGIHPRVDHGWDRIEEKRYDNKYTISSVRSILANALPQLSNEGHPTDIILPNVISVYEKELEELKLRREKLEELASKKFGTCMTNLGTIKDSRGNTENESIEYKLCPICSDLLSAYQISKRDDGNWDD